MSQAVNNAATQAVESGISAAERTKQETGKASQTASAGGDDLKREAQIKASDVQTVAADAASTAQEKFPETVAQTASTADVVQNRLAEKTNVAAEEGKKDVESAKAAGNSYVEQARVVGSNVLATAQGYVEAGQNRLSTQTQGEGVVPTLVNAASSAANTVLGITKTAINTAQETLQPHVEAARSAAQPHIDNAKTAVQPHVDTATRTAQSYAQSAADTAKPYVQSAKETIAPNEKAAKTDVDTNKF